MSQLSSFDLPSEEEKKGDEVIKLDEGIIQSMFFGLKTEFLNLD